MRCIVCDRCKAVIEDQRKVRVVTCAKPLSVWNQDKKNPARADNPQMNDILWTKELCADCADALNTFMENADNSADTTDDGTENVTI